MQKTEPQTEQLTPDEASVRALAEVRGYAEARGAKTDLAEKMTTLSGLPVSRQMIEKWLHADPAKRRQPLFGHAILLLLAYRQLTGQRARNDVTISIR